jgi:hypothetical protein
MQSFCHMLNSDLNFSHCDDIGLGKRFINAQQALVIDRQIIKLAKSGTTGCLQNLLGRGAKVFINDPCDTVAVDRFIHGLC